MAVQWNEDAFLAKLAAQNNEAMDKACDKACEKMSGKFEQIMDAKLQNLSATYDLRISAMEANTAELRGLLEDSEKRTQEALARLENNTSGSTGGGSRATRRKRDLNVSFNSASMEVDGEGTSTAFGDDVSDVPSVRAGDLARGMEGAVLDGSYKFRTAKVFGVKGPMAKKDRIAFGIACKGKYEELVGHQLNCKIVCYNDRQQKDVSLVFPSRALTWAFIDEIKAQEFGPIQVNTVSTYVNIQKVGHEKLLEDKTRRANAALRSVMGIEQGTASPFKSHFPSSKVNHENGENLGFARIENGVAVFKCHAANCTQFKVDTSAWKSKIVAFETEKQIKESEYV